MDPHQYRDPTVRLKLLVRLILFNICIDVCVYMRQNVAGRGGRGGRGGKLPTQVARDGHVEKSVQEDRFRAENELFVAWILQPLKHAASTPHIHRQSHNKKVEEVIWGEQQRQPAGHHDEAGEILQSQHCRNSFSKSWDQEKAFLTCTP